MMMNHGIHRIHGILTFAMIGMAWTMNAVADYVDANNEKYVPLSYIQASGNQWMVTDIRPTCTDTVKMKFRLSDTGSQALYCSRTHFNTNTFTAFYLNSVVRCDRYTNTVVKGNTTLSLTADTVFVADYEKRKFFVDGVEQNVLMESGNFTPGSALMLFASHTQGEALSADIESSVVANKASYRLYYFELYASGSETPKHRLVPVQRKSDAAVGLYDTVGGKFYGHANNSAAFAANQSITAVSARQRYPWNGLVDLNFTITGEEGKQYATSFTAKDMVGNTNIAMRTIRKSNGAAAATKESLLPGSYSWVWDAAADLPKDWQCDRVTVTGTAVISPFPYSVKFNANGGTGTMSNESFTYGTAKALTANAFKRTGYTFQGWATSASGTKVYNDKQSVSNLTEMSGAVVNLYAVWKSALYMVIDLSSGSSSSSYPVTYLDAVPSGGWSDTYKKTKLVLRKISAGSFIMGDNQSDQSHRVTLTKPFYCGIFEMTQKQYALVTSENPSNFRGDTLPVQEVYYSFIRGSSNGKKWPSSSAVDSSSFLGKLRARTGLAFDLPTEAQWEYACRAGTTTTYFWGSSWNNNYGWYQSNSEVKAHAVGLKKANAWGLYDMSGNVWEWCLDNYGTLAYGTDPKGVSSGSGYRIVRGGSWSENQYSCTSSNRRGNEDAHAVMSWGDLGFRIVLTLSN